LFPSYVQITLPFGASISTLLGSTELSEKPLKIKKPLKHIIILYKFKGIFKSTVERNDCSKHY
jgi:hypothetical protein